MYCENLQFDLPLYLDNVLSNDERASIDKHLPTCPKCRQKLSEYKEMRNDLRMIARPTIPANLLNSVRSAVANEFKRPTINIGTEVQMSFREKLAHWIMPYSVGTVAASIFAFFLLTFVLSSSDNTNSKFVAISEETQQTSILLTKSSPDKIRDQLSIPQDYEQISLANYQPEINPGGALMALSKSILRGKMKDEEVVIVADVFNNGLAKINEIVEAPSDDEAMGQLQKAFEIDSNAAPFLPANNRKNSESVLVILKIQRVDVVDLQPQKKVKNKKQ